jgi:hypothetical protein
MKQSLVEYQRRDAPHVDLRYHAEQVTDVRLEVLDRRKLGLESCSA